MFRKEDKVRIAEGLAELGVHRIEAGTPAVSREDEEAVREIARRQLGPKIFALARCLVEGRFVKVIDLNPPRGCDASESLDAARTMKDEGVDALCISSDIRYIFYKGSD